MLPVSFNALAQDDRRTRNQIFRDPTNIPTTGIQPRQGGTTV